MTTPPDPGELLGYQLKHTQQRFARLHAEALRRYALNGRELAVLVAVSGDEARSQQDAAARLGVDRTTMVALVDGLADKGLVTRTQDAGDRRKNVVGLTTHGKRTLPRALEASRGAERAFFSGLDAEDARTFRTLLARLAEG